MSEDNKLFEQRFDIDDEAPKKIDILGLRERLAAKDHEQWVQWSQNIIRKLEWLEKEGYSLYGAIQYLKGKYSKNWVPYNELDQSVMVWPIDRAVQIMDVLEEENII